MTTRLSIILDDDLYRRLKRELPPKGISAFINEAVRARLRPDKATLDAAYCAARKEGYRAELSTDWATTEAEAWPDCDRSTAQMRRRAEARPHQRQANDDSDGRSPLPPAGEGTG